MTPGPAEEGRKKQGEIFFSKWAFWVVKVDIWQFEFSQEMSNFERKSSTRLYFVSSLGDIKELHWRVSTVRRVCPDLLPERVPSQRDGEQACGQSEAFILTIDQSEAFILAVVLQVSKHAMWPLWSDDDYLIGFVKFMQAMLARQGT